MLRTVYTKEKGEIGGAEGEKRMPGNERDNRGREEEETEVSASTFDGSGCYGKETDTCLHEYIL